MKLPKIPRATIPMARRRRDATAAGITLLVVAALATTIVVATGQGDAAKAPARDASVPREYIETFVAASQSCPVAGPARLAGQVMEESRFSVDARTSRGGHGIAGLTDDEWETWKPSDDAERADPGANIVALAHHLCDLAGQVRVANLAGDTWQVALAAFHTGLDAVKTAGGIPADTQDYVARVADYASWFALTPGFGRAPDTMATLAGEPPASGSPDVPVPSSGAPVPAPAGPPSTSAAAAPRTTAAPPGTATTNPPRPPSPTPTTSAPLTSGALFNAEYGACLSATRAQDGSHLSIARCDGSAVQYWAPAGNTIRSVGLCMDAANAGTAIGTPVQVANCSGNPAQLFVVRSDGNIYSSYAKRCVNIDNPQGTGPVIVLWDCLSQGNQWFKFIAQ